MGVELKEATVEESLQLVGKLRDQEIDDLLVLGLTPEEALALAFDQSWHVWGGWENGELVCLWGLKLHQVLEPPEVWFFGSHSLRVKQLVKRSRQVLNEIKSAYGPVMCTVEDRAKNSARWIEWLGFKPVERAVLAGVAVTRYRSD